MNALIVAAGLSSRLRPITENLPKSLIAIQGQSLIERSVSNLERLGINKIVVVVGYLREQITAKLGNRVSYVHNPFFAQTNNLASCWFGLSEIPGEPFIYLHADLIMSPDLVKRIAEDSSEQEASLLIDFDSVDEEAMKVRLQMGRFIESSKSIPLDQAAGEWTGIAKFSSMGAKKFLKTMDDILAEGQFDVYDTVAFNRMAATGMEFKLIETSALPWCEIDTPQDLSRAVAMFSEGA